MDKKSARDYWNDLVEMGYTEEEWQDEENTWTEIDKVYTGRIDCRSKWEGVPLV